MMHNEEPHVSSYASCLNNRVWIVVYSHQSAHSSKPVASAVTFHDLHAVHKHGAEQQKKPEQKRGTLWAEMCPVLEFMS